MRGLEISQFSTTGVNVANTQAKVYPMAPKGCRSLEEFSDALEEAILKKI